MRLRYNCHHNVPTVDCIKAIALTMARFIQKGRPLASRRPSFFPYLKPPIGFVRRLITSINDTVTEPFFLATSVARSYLRAVL
jgi:hypothetical protein